MFLKNTGRTLHVRPYQLHSAAGNAAARQPKALAYYLAG